MRLVQKLDSGLPLVSVDARKLKRALSELIENAVSFMPEGGEIAITSRLLAPEERAALRLAHSNEFVEIAVADTGPGVPQESKDRIFQPFFTSRVKGMGLGLSIVKGIVEAHEGRIRETGSPGAGARFVIDLPAL